MNWKICILFLLIVCADISSQNETGLKVRISKTGLKFAANLGVDLLADQVHSITIPDFSDVKSMLSYSVSNIKISHFTKPVPEIQIIADSGISATLSNSDIELTVNWNYKLGKGWFSISDSGSAEINTKSISLSTSVNIGRDSNGKPTASSDVCSCIITGFDIHINSGRVASMYNLIFGWFNNQIKALIQSTVCNTVKKLINQNGNSMLATLQTDVMIDSLISLDYKLSGDPIFTPQYLETFHAGEFYTDTEIKYNAINPQMEINLNDDKMISLALTERLFNSASFVLQQLGKMNQIFPINDENIAVLLNIPDPENTKLVIMIETTKAPFIIIASSSFAINATAIVELQKISGEVVLQLQVSLLLDCDVYFEENRIKGKVNDIKPFILVNSGKIDTLTSKELTDMLVDLINLALPSLNERGALGFPLPGLDNLVLINPTLNIDNGYVKLGCDFQYQP